MKHVTQRFTWDIELPHYCPPDEDCMGNPVEGHWRCWARLLTPSGEKEGKTLAGYGGSAEAAVEDAKRGIAGAEGKIPDHMPRLKLDPQHQRGDSIDLLRTFELTYGAAPNRDQRGYLSNVTAMWPLTSQQAAALALVNARAMFARE